MKKVKLFAMAVAALFASSISAKDPSAALDVAEVASGDYYETECVPDIKNLDWVGYNSTGSGSGSILSGSRWKLSSSRTITFKVKNCGAVELQVEFAKDATTSVKYSIDGATAEQFVTNGDDKKCVKVGSFKTGTKDEFSVTISSTQDLFLGYVRFYLPEDDADYPFVKSFTMGDVEAVVDTTAKTIVAELPYGTDRAAAIAGATVVMGGTAKTFSIAGDVLTAIDSVNTDKNINYDLTGIVVAQNPSTDATLSMITIDGVDLAGFDPAVLSYSMVTTSIPTVDAVLNDPTAKYQVNPALGFPGMTEIFVTAQDGVTKLTYSINFTSADKVCGQLVKVTVASGKAGTVTGALPATADVSLSSSGKMDSGKYFGITLTQGAFRAGDVFNVNTSTAAGQGFLAIYADKAMTTLVYEGGDYGVQGDNLMVLPAAADGLTTLYMARNDNINKWNGVISFIEVTRDCEPKLMSFSLAGIDAVIDQDLLTVTAELPYGTVLTDNDWNNAYKLNAVATGAEYGAEHATLAVKGGDEDLVYTLAISISEEESENANLTEIKVNGNAIAGFRADSMAYTYELPYSTTELAVIAATAEDIKATVAIDEITANTQLVNIVVTAQAGNTLTYTVQLAIASAPKNVTYVKMSNGMEAWQLDGDETIYAYYTAGEAEPTISEVNVNEGATYSILGNVITVTGADQTTKDYTVQIAAVSPVEFGTATITFDGTETWIKSGYGFDSSKKWRFSKTDNDNSREWAGKTRIYMFLSACDTISLTESASQTRNIFIYANGQQVYNGTPAKNSTYDVVVEQAAPFMLEIRSNQTGGDGGVGAIRMAKKSTDPTALRDAMMNGKAQKFMMNNRLYIRHNGMIFDIMGHMMAK